MTQKAPPENQSELKRVDGSASASLIVDIARIRRYERDPRHGPNPEYDRIKDSIRRHGLDQPLVITKRPDAADYIVHTGGNTRLTILKELFEETGEGWFSRVPCVFKPWTRESDVVLAHLRENDLRGNLTFTDKARAIQDARRLLAGELGVKDLSQAQLDTELKKAGYRIHQGLISRMAYAVERLLPLIPKALEAGLGKHQVGRIRTQERAARRIWRQRGNDSEFDAVFEALCRRYDGPDWDTDLLQGALETEMAEAAEVSLHTIRMALDAELTGRAVEVPEFVPIKSPAEPGDPDHTDEDPAQGEVFDIGEADQVGPTPADEGPLRSEETLTELQEYPDDLTTEDPQPQLDVDPSYPTDLKSLRGRLWTLAARLAQRNGIGDLVVPLPGKGLGFVLRDVPDPGLADQLDEDALAQVCTLWWQLAACSEMTVAPIESIVPVLPSDSVLRRALEDQDAELLFNSIWTLDPGHTGYRLWWVLHDRDWADLLNLMAAYRRIRQLAADTGTPIWEVP